MNKRPIDPPHQHQARAQAQPQASQAPEARKASVPAHVHPHREPHPSNAAEAQTALPSDKKFASLFQRKQEFIKPTDIIRIRGNVDRPMLIIILLLFCFGCIMVFSASYSVALSSKGDSYYYIKRHLIFALVGFVALILAAHFDYRWIHKCVLPVYIATQVLLAAVLIYGVASGVAQRWIVIGPINFQPSEIMKLAMVLMLASYIARYQYYITDYSDFWRSIKYGNIIPFLLVGISVFLVILEQHLSGTIIIAMIGIVVIFAGGGRKMGFGAAGIILLVFLIIMTQSGYAEERLDTFINQDQYWNPEKGEISDEVWQTVQGLIAVGSGGLFGVGLGNSRQKHSFVPMPHNDFIYSIICEELGLIGALCVILLFIFFIWRGFVIARRAPDTFSSMVVIGITTQVGLQAILNIMVVTNLIPNTGVSLPFFSYGGTSLMMLLGEMGIILSISRYSYQKQ